MKEIIIKILVSLSAIALFIISYLAISIVTMVIVISLFLIKR